jgi:predicted metal-dependent hydrolase
MPTFQFGTTGLEYDLVKSKEQKDVSISLEWLEGLKIVAPESITTDQLQLISNKKAPWIIKNWYELNELVGTPSPKEYVSGEKFLYLGRSYKLKVLVDEDRDSRGHNSCPFCPNKY